MLARGDLFIYFFCQQFVRTAGNGGNGVSNKCGTDQLFATRKVVMKKKLFTLYFMLQKHLW